MEFMENVLFAIGGLLAAILAAWLSAKWSVRKFYSEKWWERKEKAYAEIIEALYDVLQYCEIKKEDYGNNQRYGEDKMKELAEKQNNAWWKLRRASAIGAFVMSPKATEALNELLARPDPN